MRGRIIAGILIMGFIACSRPTEDIIWDFSTPEGDITYIQDLLGNYYLLSEEIGPLIYNGFSLAIKDTTVNTFRYVYKNRWYDHLNQILAVEISTNKVYEIIQVGIYVKAKEKYYKSWKEYMLQSGYKASDIYAKMNGDMDAYFNDSVDALILMTVNPYLILYSDKELAADED